MNIGDGYTCISALGYGASATVYRAVHKATGRECAIKRIDKARMDMKTVEREISIMKEIDSPFIVPFFDAYEDESCMNIVMAYCEGGNLMSHIIRHGRLPEEEAKVMFVELIFGLRHLHLTSQILHRDIKTENVLMDKHGHVRLSDFGFSCKFDINNALTSTYCGSPAYVAPEMIMREAYTSKADIWSAGVVLYVMLTGTLPFVGANIQECMHAVVEKQPEFPSYLSDESCDLLSRLLAKNPRERPDVSGVLADPWVRSCALYSKILNIAKGPEKHTPPRDAWALKDCHEMTMKRELGVLSNSWYAKGQSMSPQPRRQKRCSQLPTNIPLTLAARTSPFGKSSPEINQRRTMRRQLPLNRLFAKKNMLA